jgi:hypothetical protein
MIRGSVKSGQSIKGSVARAETIVERELVFNNHFEFPSIGEEGKLYIAKDENKIYRFSETNYTYYCIGSDYNEIEEIICIL